MPADIPPIIGVAPGDPFDRRTWSGASHHLFAALRRRDALATAIDATPPKLADLAARAISIHPDRGRWVERYEYSPLRRAVASRVASRRLAAASEGRPYVSLQIGAWYDLRPGSRPPAMRCSYHDSNLALFSRHGTFIADPSARHIQRELANERKVFDRLDLIFPMSDWVRASLLEDFGQPEGKVVTVGSGANTDQIPDSVPDRDFRDPRLLMIGYDFELKGGPTALEAFRYLRARHPAAELWIAGPPIPAGSHEAGVRWLGPIRRDRPGGDDRIRDLYATATVYLQASRYDAFPNAFLEAMAYGLPCVGTAVGAIPEIIQSGETGFVVPRDDPEALGDALLGLADHPDRARAMGLAGRQRAEDRLNWDAVADRMLSAIAEALSHRRATDSPCGGPPRLHKRLLRVEGGT